MKKKLNLNIITLAAFALGIILGLICPGIFSSISFIGDIYINVLKLLVIPLLMTGVTGSACKAAGKGVGGRIIRAILLFVLMFVISFAIMSLVCVLFRPGNGADLLGSDWDGELAATTLGEFFSAIIPSNIISAMSSNSILACIIFAFAFGIAIAKTGGEKLAEVIGNIEAAFSRLLEYAMWIAPFGVFALMGNTIANYGAEIIGTCAKYLAFAWGGCVIVTLLVMILPVWLYAGVSPVTYIRKVSRIWVTTLSTCSSAATLPSTIKVCENEFGIPGEVVSMVAPLGCTIHMCGGAVSFCLLGFFTMQMAAVPVTAGLYIYMLVLATLINMAAPGIPGGGIVIGATYLSILGAPTGFIGMYSGIYRLLDMVYTTVNVTGDISACLIISAYEKKKKKNADN